jgi:hypothetical protein
LEVPVPSSFTQLEKNKRKTAVTERVKNFMI